jgi:hypothetical protein
MAADQFVNLLAAITLIEMMVTLGLGVKAFRRVRGWQTARFGASCVVSKLPPCAHGGSGLAAALSCQSKCLRPDFWLPRCAQAPPMFLASHRWRKETLRFPSG